MKIIRAPEAFHRNGFGRMDVVVCLFILALVVAVMAPALNRALTHCCTEAGMLE